MAQAVIAQPFELESQWAPQHAIGIADDEEDLVGSHPKKTEEFVRLQTLSPDKDCDQQQVMATWNAQQNAQSHTNTSDEGRGGMSLERITNDTLTKSLYVLPQTTSHGTDDERGLATSHSESRMPLYISKAYDLQLALRLRNNLVSPARPKRSRKLALCLCNNLRFL